MSFVLLGVVFCATDNLHAQQATPAANLANICAVTFNDVNNNKTRDPGEGALSNVNVSLMINNVVIANHVTDVKDTQYCFNNLVPGLYTLSFTAPLAANTTINTFTLPLNGGEQVIREFGGVPIDQVTPQSTSNGLVIPLTRPVRIGLAVGGALLVMLLTVGIGLIGRGLYNVVGRR